MEIAKEITVKSNGTTFSAINEAERILKSEGYTVGTMCRDEPIGFAPASQYSCIAKWRNLDSRDKKLLSGIITSNDFRDGDVKITYYKNDVVQF